MILALKLTLFHDGFILNPIHTQDLGPQWLLEQPYMVTMELVADSILNGQLSARLSAYLAAMDKHVAACKVSLWC